MLFAKNTVLVLLISACSTIAFSYGTKGFKKAPLSAHPYAAAKSISGKVIVDGKIAQKHSMKFDDNDVLYIIVNKHGVKRGAPVAVKKISGLKSKPFPIEFMVGAQDSMGGHEASFVGPFSVKVKLSRTGDAMSSPGDLIGYSSDKPIKEGTKGVEVVLTEVVGH